jgi:hypothetical protein
MLRSSAKWLAFAGLVGVIAALLGSRRAASRQAGSPRYVFCPGPERKADPEAEPARPWWYGLAVLVIAGVFAGAAIFGYNELSRWYLPVNLTASTTSLANGQQVTLAAGSGQAVQWTVTSGFAGQLTVVGPGPGSAEIMLPVPVSRCPKVTAKLGVKCGAGGITLPSPAEFSWSTPQELTSPNGSQTAATLSVEPSTGAGGAPGVIMSVTSAHPVLCLSAQGRAMLTISVGLRQYTQPFSGFTPCDGIVAVVGSAGSTPPAFKLDDVDGLSLTASAPAGTLQGLTGQVMLHPGGNSVQASPTVVSGTALAAAFNFEPGSQDLMVAARTASVMTGGSQLVPSEWSRETIVFGPLLGVAVTALVGTPLGVSLGVLMAALKRRLGPPRRSQEEGSSP